MRPERAFDTGSWMTSNKLQWYQVISVAISGYFINMTESRWEKTHTTAAFLNIKQNLNTSFPQEKPDLKYRQYIWIQNASTKIMHLLYIEYVPQLRPSPQLIRKETMIEMVSDDLLAVYRKWMRAKPKVELQIINYRKFPSFHERSAHQARDPIILIWLVHVINS